MPSGHFSRFIVGTVSSFVPPCGILLRPSALSDTSVLQPLSHPVDKHEDQTGTATVQPSTKAEGKHDDPTTVHSMSPIVDDKHADQTVVETTVSKKRRNTEGDTYLSRRTSTVVDNKGSGILIAVVVFVLVLALVGAGVVVYLMVPRPPDRRVDICRTKGCELHGHALYRAINHDVDPCDNFHTHVCGSWDDALRKISTEEDMMSDGVDMAIKVLEKDRKRQNMAQTFFSSCIDARENRDQNLHQFLEFKRSLGLVWPHEEPTGSTHPLDIMLRLAIKWGMNFLFDVSVVDGYHQAPKLFIGRGRLDTAWNKRVSDPVVANDYLTIVQGHYTALGVNFNDVPISVERLRKTENAILDAKVRTMNDLPDQEWFPASALDNKTQSAPPGIWLAMLAKHDDDFEWKPDSPVIVEHVGILSNLDSLIKDHANSTSTLVIGLTWVFIQTHLWAALGEPALRFHWAEADRRVALKNEACLDYVDSKLGLLSVSKPLSDKFGLTPLNIDSFAKRIKNRLKILINELTWVEHSVKEEAWRKLDLMTRIVLPPEEFFRSESRRELYSAFPNMTGETFMSNLINASIAYSQMRRSRVFMDVYSRRMFPPTGLSSYLYLPNTMSIAVGLLAPPAYYPDATFAILYASLGGFIARELTKTLDEKGTSLTHDGRAVRWWGVGSSASSAAQYESKVRCDLGTSKKPSMGRPLGLFPTVPALEVSYASFMGAIATDFRSLVDFKVHRLEEYTDEQIFFLSYCYAMCAKRPQTMGDECNVALKNFPHFAAAFNCPEGSPMNPAVKCTFFNVSRKET
ncbi:neprilysin-1-like isoform X1 [Amblyomma americanum]